MASTRGPGFTALLGRILLVVIYLVSGAGKIADPEGTQGYMASKNMPMIPVLFILAIIFELVGGASVVLGLKARWGAPMLIIFTVLATLIFHNFWAVPAAEKQMQMVNFLKNVGLIGGLLLIIAYGPGPISFDSRRRGAGEVFPA